MFLLDLLWLCEVSEVSFELFLVMPGLCLFFLASLCARLIPLTMVDEWWHFVENLQIVRSKTYVKYFDRYQIYFYSTLIN